MSSYLDWLTGVILATTLADHIVHYSVFLKRRIKGCGMKFRGFAFIGAAFMMVGATSAAPAASASTTSSTSVVTVKVQSTVGNPGDIQVQDSSGNVLATCQGPTSPGTAKCMIDVTTGQGILLVAQPVTPGTFLDWTAACKSVPGPICHQSVTRNLKVVGNFQSTASTPSAATTTTFVEGDATGCSGFDDVVTVNGIGFPATTAVTLKDNGRQVASGTTDGSGAAQLSFTANSEPGIYRTLVMKASGSKATTDIYNEGSYCLDQVNGQGTGTVSFEVVATDLDANGAGTIQFASKPPVPTRANASGTYTVTTPGYSCTPGASKNLVLKNVRGGGSPFSFEDVVIFAITC